MRRASLIGFAAVAVAACHGGAREVGRAMLAPANAARGGPSSSALAVGSHARGAAGDDEPAPALRTLHAPDVARGAAAAAGSTAVPPAGGVVVRAAGAAPPARGPTVRLDDATARRRGAVPRRSRDLLVREVQLTASLASSLEGGASPSRARWPPPAAARAAPTDSPSASAPRAPAAPRTQQFHFSDDVVTGSLARPNGEAIMALRAVAQPGPAARAPARPPPPSANVATVAAVPQPPPAPPPAAAVVVQQQQAPAVLTAATVGDHDRRDNYLAYLARHRGEAERLGLDMTRRVRFHVVDAQGHPVNDARITLSAGWLHRVGRTHADGWWDFFPSADVRNAVGALAAEVQVGPLAVRTTVPLPSQGDAPAPVVIRLPGVHAAPATAPVLDLGFAIDVTGSMGDEIAYVTREVGGIVQRIEAAAPGVRVRVGATFYRDRGDTDPLQQIAFTSNVPGFAATMQRVGAAGGGDYPEDMNAALEAAVAGMGWSEGPAVRVLVLIADAPPQMYPDEHFTWRDAMSEASRRGIRVLPVAASGADDTVEYLFRAMATYTSTPYVYLTDDSGVGAPHQEADTDRVGIERFADALTRMVTADLRGQGMHEPGPLGPQG